MVGAGSGAFILGQCFGLRQIPREGWVYAISVASVFRSNRIIILPTVAVRHHRPSLCEPGPIEGLPRRLG